MEKLRAGSFQILSLQGMALLGALTLVVSVLSFAFEVSRAQSSVRQYVAIWEDDIARAKVFQGDPSLQNKILSQLQEVHPAVKRTTTTGEGEGQCAFVVRPPLTLNSLPVGELKVCFEVTEMLMQALLSPVFLGGLLLGLLFLGWGLRRDFNNRLQQHKLESEMLKNKEIAQMSRQVAHDIRGPLTALTTLSQLSHEMSPDKKELLNLAVARIRGIAEDLLVRGGNHSKPEKISVAGASGPDLAVLIESLLKEYRFANPQVQIRWHKHTSVPQSLIPLEAIKAQRIVSNLINNSLEALPEKEAAIDVTLMERNNSWLLQIMDNGNGIPEEVLPRLCQEGVSFGKDHGNGLGLFDARKTLESIGGELQIRSRVGVGTQVVLVIPKVIDSVAEIS